MKKYLRQNKKNAEIAEDTKKILHGEPVDDESENAVQDVPDKFKQWMEDNRERMDEARKRGTLPYFITDNERKAWYDTASRLIIRFTSRFLDNLSIPSKKPEQ